MHICYDLFQFLIKAKGHFDSFLGLYRIMYIPYYNFFVSKDIFNNS